MTNSHTGKKGKGFAGLDALVSDVSDIPEERATPAAIPVEVPVVERPVPEPATRAVPPKPQARRAGPAKAKATETEKAAYFWVAVCLIIFTIWVFNSGSSSSHHVDPPVLTEAPTQSSPPALEAAAPTAPAPTPEALDERMPAVGYNNVLGIPEIRWCQRQQIEIDAIQTIVSDERAYEVEHFNAKVNDYNSRCGNFRYRRGHLEQVQQEFSSERESIASKAKSQWMRRALGLDEATEAPATNSEASIPERRVDRPQSTESLSIASLNSAERASIESACSGAKVLEGQAAYEKCLAKKLAALKTAPRNNDLSSLSQTERDSLESACSGPKLLDGPAAYNKCVAAKLTAFHSAPHNIDLSALNDTERTSIESACSGPRLLDGPAAYNKCLASKLAAFRSGPRNIDLSWLNDTERQSLESACSGPRLLDGPAAYNKCLTKKLKQLRS